MKKYLWLILLLVTWVPPASADYDYAVRGVNGELIQLAAIQQQQTTLLGQYNAAAAGGDYCSGKLNYELYFDADHTTNNLFACVTGDTNTGVLSGATIATPATPSNDATWGVAGASGGDALHLDAGGESLTFTWTLDTATSTITMLIWLIDLTDTIDEFFIADGCDNLYLEVQDDTELYIRHETNEPGGIVAFVGGPNADMEISDGSSYGWQRVTITWDATRGAGTDELAMRQGLTAWRAAQQWYGDADADDLIACTGQTTITFQIDAGDTNRLYVDDIQVDNGTYQQTSW